MTTVKFDRSVKYQGVRYAAHEVFKVNDEDVDQLKQAGATVLSVEAPVTPPVDDTVTPPADDTVTPPVEDEQEQEGAAEEEQEAETEDVDQLKQELLEYTVPELVKFAEERNIDLQKKTKKAEIYNIIVAAI